MIPMNSVSSTSIGQPPTGFEADGRVKFNRQEREVDELISERYFIDISINWGMLPEQDLST